MFALHSLLLFETSKLYLFRVTQMFYNWGAWVAQLSDRLLISAQVVISQFMGLSLHQAASIGPAWDSLSPSLFPPPLLTYSLSLSLKMNK